MTKEEKIRKIEEINDHLDKAYNILHEIHNDGHEGEINLPHSYEIGYMEGRFSDIWHTLEYYRQLIEEEA